MIKASLLIISLFVFSGCSLFSGNNLKGSYVEKKRVNASLEGIIKAFDRATLGVRGQSANGREIVSRYQSPNGRNESAATKKNRAYARLLILGERRPYDLQVQFVTEEDQGEGDYQALQTDDEMARKILKKVLDGLASRPDTKDFIDDFRAF